MWCLLCSFGFVGAITVTLAVMGDGLPTFAEILGGVLAIAVIMLLFNTMLLAIRCYKQWLASRVTWVPVEPLTEEANKHRVVIDPDGNLI